MMMVHRYTEKKRTLNSSQRELCGQTIKTLFRPESNSRIVKIVFDCTTLVYRTVLSLNLII